MSEFLEQVAAETGRVRAKNRKLASLHEGYGVILEEIEEFWDQVKLKDRKRDYENIATELVQIAAVAQRIFEDVVAPVLAARRAAAK